MTSRLGLADSFCKWPDCTYFRLVGQAAKVRVLLGAYVNLPRGI